MIRDHKNKSDETGNYLYTCVDPYCGCAPGFLKWISKSVCVCVLFVYLSFWTHMNKTLHAKFSLYFEARSQRAGIKFQASKFYYKAVCVQFTCNCFFNICNIG